MRCIILVLVLIAVSYIGKSKNTPEWIYGSSAGGIVNIDYSLKDNLILVGDLNVLQVIV